MLDIGFVETVASPLFDIYQRIETDLLTNVARRLRHAESATPSAEWQLMKLQQFGALNKDNERAIAKYSGQIESEIARIIAECGFESVREEETLYQMAFGRGKLEFMPEALRADPIIQDIINTMIEHAVNEMNLVNTTALQSAGTAFTDALNQAYIEHATGMTTLDESLRRATRKMADNGIKGADYISKKGRRTFNHIEVAVRRAIRTSTSQVAGELQLKRAEQYGSDLVEVSSHAGSRPEHARWQGKIYSLSGKSKKYPDFRICGYGKVDGIKGANCDHDFYPYIEGISRKRFEPYPLQESAEIYEQSQQQRKLERDIRSVKRQIITAEAMGDSEGMLQGHSKLRNRQKKMREFIGETGRTRRNNREQLVTYETGVVTRARRMK